MHRMRGRLIRKIMKGVYPPLPAGKFSAQLSDMLKLCLTMDHRQRPDSAALLANTSLINRARSLGIDLDPDAKNVSCRPPASAAAACVSEEPKSASERPPLAEMALLWKSHLGNFRPIRTCVSRCARLMFL